jgi:hypothetical protein
MVHEVDGRVFRWPCVDNSAEDIGGIDMFGMRMSLRYHGTTTNIRTIYYFHA